MHLIFLTKFTTISFNNVSNVVGNIFINSIPNIVSWDKLTNACCPIIILFPYQNFIKIMWQWYRAIKAFVTICQFRFLKIINFSIHIHYYKTWV
jgi:hypothetical protein